MTAANDKRSEDASRAEIATLGGGCFWCLEAVFDELRGVEEVVSGYSGGTVPDPTYEQVCTGQERPTPLRQRRPRLALPTP